MKETSKKPLKSASTKVIDDLKKVFLLTYLFA